MDKRFEFLMYQTAEEDVSVNALLTQQQGRILGFSNQKIFPHARTFSPNKDEISNKK